MLKVYRQHRPKPKTVMIAELVETLHVTA